MSETSFDSTGEKIALYSIAGIGVAVATVGLIILSYIWSGWVLSVLWGWFMVTTFSAPAISIVEAIGLSIIVGLFTQHLASKADVRDEDGIKLIRSLFIRAFTLPLVSLGVGWIVYQFI
jgi:hypothetical protein